MGKTKRYILILSVVFIVCIGGGLAAQQHKEIALKPIKSGFPQDKPIVLKVAEGSPGAVAGLKVGDLIISVDAFKVSTKGEFIKTLKAKRAKKNSFPLEVIRRGKLETFTVEFKKPSKKLGVYIGDYFIIHKKPPQPSAMFQKKGRFGVGVNGKVMLGKVVRLNIRVDNFSKSASKIGVDSITVTADGASLARLSPKDAVNIFWPEPAASSKDKELAGLKLRKLNKRKEILQKKRAKELKMWEQLELKESDVLPRKPVIGSLFYKNPHEKYPISLKIKFGDQLFEFLFEEEIE